MDDERCDRSPGHELPAREEPAIKKMKCKPARPAFTALNPPCARPPCSSPLAPERIPTLSIYSAEHRRNRRKQKENILPHPGESETSVSSPRFSGGGACAPRDSAAAAGGGGPLPVQQLRCARTSPAKAGEETPVSSSRSEEVRAHAVALAKACCTGWSYPRAIPSTAL